MNDKAKESVVHIKGTAAISVVSGVLQVQGDLGGIADLGDVTHKKLNELIAALNSLNQHLFKEARFDLDSFLAIKNQESAGSE